MKKLLIRLVATFALVAVFSIIQVFSTSSFIVPSFQTVVDDTKASDKSDTVKKSNYYNDIPVDPSESGISDTYGFFDDDMLEAMNGLVQDKAEELDMNIFVFIANKKYGMTDYQTECFADDTYDEMYGEDTDGVFYFIDFTGEQPAYDYISTSGKAVLMYEKNIQSIHDACQSILPPSGLDDYSGYSDEVANVVGQFLTQLDYYYNNSNVKYYHDSSSDKYFYYKGDKLVISYNPPLYKRLIPLIVALPVGIIAMLIFYFVTKSRYKFKKSENPVVYVSHEETQFIQKDDRFIRAYTTKTKIETDNSGSSGGGGGGGHSSSGGHGGGGSHR